jgi:sugar phosphate permease
MTNETTPLLADDRARRTSIIEDAFGNSLARTLSPSHWLAPESGAEIEEDEQAKSRDSSSKDAPYLIDLTPTRFWVMYLPILLVYFVATFDSTLMASSHPVITSYFHSSNSASWLSTAFMLTSTTFQPLYGRLSDTFGRRLLYIFALIMFGATTAWCGLANSMTSFIVARAFCGLGAGGVMGMVGSSILILGKTC